MSEALIALVIALADDELILGHRHSEWTGFAPHIEEDVAFSSIAQDEIGHAAALYSLAADIIGTDPDRLALGREPGDYRNAVLCERPNGDWSYTLARQWLYDTADSLRLEALGRTAHEELRALVTKMRREERYHMIHADMWMKRIASGPIEGRALMIDSLTAAFAESQGLFEAIDLEDEALEKGWLPLPSEELHGRFMELATNQLDELGLPTTIHAHLDEQAEFVASSSGDLIAQDGGSTGAAAPGPSSLGGRRGRHSDDFQALWDEMTSTYRNNLGATW